MAKRKSESWEWMKALFIALIIAAGIRYFIFAPIIVDGQSMMPTLHDEDMLIVSKMSYTIGDPERFDIIVFHAPEGKDYIKRIIGLPGDKIEYKDDQLYVNGKKVDEPFLDEYKQALTKGDLTYDFDLMSEIGQATVPEGELFVMGDNRRHSKDSRMIGAVPMEKVIGEANIIFWPLSDFHVFE